MPSNLDHSVSTGLAIVDLEKACRVKITLSSQVVIGISNVSASETIQRNFISLRCRNSTQQVHYTEDSWIFQTLMYRTALSR